MSNSSYIIAAKRSPVAPRGGALSHLNLHELGSPIVDALLADAGIAHEQVDELIVGNALGAGGNPARVVALASGLKETVAGLSIDRQCCSGMDAIMMANDMISSGRASIVIAGGIESYSQRPHRFIQPAGSTQLQAYDQPPFTPWPDRDPDMTKAADALAQELGISFETQNAWAIHSHEKALNRQRNASNEIVSVAELTTDSYTRSLKMKTCNRATRLSGTVSVANTAVAADGAAFCLVVNEDIATRFLKSKLRIVSGTTLGANPMLPGLAPVAAMQYVITQAIIDSSQLQCVEMMEAYAAQAIACVQQLDIDSTVCNRGGGALARGHPIGASGAILMTRLFHEMIDEQGFALAAIAAAGGLGSALLVHSA